MGLVALPSGRINVHQLPQIGRGAADDIVMVHGLGANFGFWYASAVQWFRRAGRVTLFDLPGHGDSDMPATGYSPGRLGVLVGELLDHLRIERAHLVAHSFGGVVALSFAAQQQHRVKSLVLADVRVWAVEPPSVLPESALWLQRARDAGLRLADPRLDLSVQVLMDLARMRLEHDEPQPAVFEVMPGARSLFRGRRSALKWLKLIETTRAYDEITDPEGLDLADVASIRQPMLAAYGGLSARKHSAMALQQLCPDCRLRLIRKAGHFFPLTRPAIFARPALAFLRATNRGDTVLPRRQPAQPVIADQAERVMADALS